ncbi:MAG: gliding motility-associated C-terminal domain-containing protein [Bacteroidota bacterium]
MLNWRKLTLCLAGLITLVCATAQVTYEVTVLRGDASSDCDDLIGAPDYVWSVNIADEGWVDYDGSDNCNLLQSLPNTQYRTSLDCPNDEPLRIPICIRAFENDPGVANPCDLIRPDDCMVEDCQEFEVPLPGESAEYTFSLPNGGAASAQVILRITANGFFPGGLNNLPCTAVDLGVLSVDGRVGDASRSQFTNYCGTRSNDEPDPITLNAGWGNNVGVWYSFRTSDEPGDRFVINGNSDPENLGDPVFLQIGIYEALDNTCDGSNFDYIGGSGRSRNDPSFDENIQFSCDQPLKPNTTYYIIVDGVVDTEEELFGLFGLEVLAISNRPVIQEVTICAEETFPVFNQIYSESGLYRDSIRLAVGCDSVVITNLTVLEPLVISTNQNAIATGEMVADGRVTVMVSGGAGDYEIVWSDGVEGANRDDLLGGETYEITVIDGEGCSIQTTITIEFTVLLAASVTNDTLNCFGDTNGRIIIKASNGEPPYDYTWRSTNHDRLQGSGTIREDGGIAGLTDLPAGIYEVIINDGFSPEVILNAIVSQPDELIAAATDAQAASCFGTCDAQFTIDVQGGNVPYTFDIGGNNLEENSLIVQNLCAGSFTSLVTDAKGCIAMLQTTLEEPEEFIAEVANQKDVSCFEGSDGEITITTNGNPIAFDWNNGENDATISDLMAGQYEVTVTNEDGCQDEISASINQPNQPLEVELQVAQEIRCFDANDGILSANVEGTEEAIIYNWSNGENSEIISNLAPGTYSLMIEDAKGCIAEDEIFITQPEPIIVSFSTQSIGCQDLPNSGSILVDTVTGGVFPYEFSVDGVLFSRSQRVSNLFEGTYDLIVKDANGCETSETAQIEGPPEISINLGKDIVINLGESTTLKAFTNAENPIFNWLSGDSLSCNNCPELEVRPFFKTEYLVQVTDSITQCTASDRISVAVDRTRRVYIPNAFSPNGDDSNSRFTVYGGNMIQNVKSLRIFNRKGQLVFERFDLSPNDETNGWNGLYQGQRLSPDIFVYYAEVEFIDEEMQVYTGDVLLVR